MEKHRGGLLKILDGTTPPFKRRSFSLQMCMVLILILALLRLPLAAATLRKFDFKFILVLVVAEHWKPSFCSSGEVYVVSSDGNFSCPFNFNCMIIGLWVYVQGFNWRLFGFLVRRKVLEIVRCCCFFPNWITLWDVVMWILIKLLWVCASFCALRWFGVRHTLCFIPNYWFLINFILLYK